MNQRQLLEAPEIIGLSIFALCSDLLILSNSDYPDQFVADFLIDLHDRAKKIALRTRKNALKKCNPILKMNHVGVELDSVPELQEIKENKSSIIQVNIGKGLPDLIAIIAAGGRSTRVQSIIPKPILKLHGKYLIMHTIDNLKNAFGSKIAIYISLGWESELVKSCLGYDYRFLSMPRPSDNKRKHLALGPGARIYTALNQLELFGGPVITCYSDMPLVSSNSLEELYNKFDSENHQLCFLTSKKAPLPGSVIRDKSGDVLRIAHSRYEIINNNPEKDVGYYLFQNTNSIRRIMGKIRNDNMKKEYSTHHLIEALVNHGEKIGTVNIPRDECYTVNTARDLFWLSMGLNRRSPEIKENLSYFELFQEDYGVTFTEKWFEQTRKYLSLIFNPNKDFDRQVPLHFLNEFIDEY